MKNKEDMNQSRVPEPLKKSWIKFLLSCFIFLLSFNYRSICYTSSTISRFVLHNANPITKTSNPIRRD